MERWHRFSEELRNIVKGGDKIKQGQLKFGKQALYQYMKVYQNMCYYSLNAY